MRRQAREIARASGLPESDRGPDAPRGQPVGAIAVARRDGPFSAGQIALLKTFADQAVIAIENVRLFRELEARNRELTQSLEQQTATGEVLRVVSQSQTDVQPGFDTIVRDASRLCGASHGSVYLFDGELVHAVAHTRRSDCSSGEQRGRNPRPRLAWPAPRSGLEAHPESPTSKRIRGG